MTNSLFRSFFFKLAHFNLLYQVVIVLNSKYNKTTVIPTLKTNFKISFIILLLRWTCFIMVVGSLFSLPFSHYATSVIIRYLIKYIEIKVSSISLFSSLIALIRLFILSILSPPYNYIILPQ